MSFVICSALHKREEHSKVPITEPISRKEFIAMVTDRPVCIWGECYPASEEAQRRQQAEKEEEEELARLKERELKEREKSNTGVN